jgi:hypothetical protein
LAFLAISYVVFVIVNRKTIYNKYNSIKQNKIHQRNLNQIKMLQAALKNDVPIAPVSDLPASSVPSTDPPVVPAPSAPLQNTHSNGPAVPISLPSSIFGYQVPRAFPSLQEINEIYGK